MTSLYPLAVPHRLAGIPSGVDGVRATLAEMVKMTRLYKKDIGIINLARKLITNPPLKLASERLSRLQAFVRDKILYVPDPLDGPELVQTPKRTLEIGTGDCDDKATLLAALLTSIGIPVRFRAVGFDNGPYSHVLVQARLGRGWHDLETILDNVRAGWGPPNTTRNMVAHV
jgi:Transglutaminase-like enzymes, putative cysteine proteases